LYLSKYNPIPNAPINKSGKVRIIYHADSEKARDTKEIALTVDIIIA